MSSDEYIMQNIYRYSRKSYKKDAKDPIDSYGGARGVELPEDGPEIISPMCSCELDSKGVMANILHKKCPIIALAQQQLQRVTDETDRIYYYNNRCGRPAYDFLLLWKELTIGENKLTCILLFCIGLAFFIGILLGAASCGTYLRKFNSPVFACIDHLFAYDTRAKDGARYSIY